MSLNSSTPISVRERLGLLSSCLAGFEPVVAVGQRLGRMASTARAITAIHVVSTSFSLMVSSPYNAEYRLRCGFCQRLDACLSGSSGKKEAGDAGRLSLRDLRTAGLRIYSPSRSPVHGFDALAEGIALVAFVPYFAANATRQPGARPCTAGGVLDRVGRSALERAWSARRTCRVRCCRSCGAVRRRRQRVRLALGLAVLDRDPVHLVHCLRRASTRIRRRRSASCSCRTSRLNVVTPISAGNALQNWPASLKSVWAAAAKLPYSQGRKGYANHPCSFHFVPP